MMKRPFPLSLGLLLTLWISAIPAAEVTVDFTATVRDTTCTMDIESAGLPVLSDLNGNFELVIPEVGLDAIINKTAAAQANFRLRPKNCNAPLTGLTMTLTSPHLSAYSKILAANDQSIAEHTDYLGAAFKRAGSDDSGFILLDGTQTLVWTSDERINGLLMTTALRETLANKAKAGNFETKVTFTFTYQ